DLELGVSLIFGLISGSLQQQFTALPVKLDIAPTLLVCVRDSNRLINELKPGCGVSGLAVESGEQSKMVRKAKSSVGSPEIFKRRIEGRQTFVELAEFRDRPGANQATPRPIIIEAVFAADTPCLCRRFERGLRISPELMKHRKIVERERD